MKKLKKEDRHAEYFEAILQLRPLNDELIKFALDQIEADGDVTIAKTVEKKYGVDLYLSSNTFTKKLGYKLKKRFRNGTLTVSRLHYSTDHMSSKHIFRLTILFRLDEKRDEE